MTFPRKFKSRLELTKTEVVRPDGAWITYAVCGCERKSCRWEGWILESLTKPGKRAEQLPTSDPFVCPKCGRELFRTEVSYRFTRSTNQRRQLIPGKDYIALPVHYG